MRDCAWGQARLRERRGHDGRRPLGPGAAVVLLWLGAAGCIVIEEAPPGADFDIQTDTTAVDVLPGFGDVAAPAPAPPKASVTTTVGGYVYDARGKSLHAVDVGTWPPTATMKTNLAGHYVLGAGHSFGVLTVLADKPGYRQTRPVCVQLTAGQYTFADIRLIKTEDAVPDDACEPACAAGETCLGGFCVTRCEPACPCTEICTAAGTCVPNPDIPTESACGPNSLWLGGGVCQCKTGFVPAPDGRSCLTPAQLASCPVGAAITPLGCECQPGLVPTRTGDRCVTPEEAAVVRPLGDGVVVGTWATPGKAPRGLAFDGESVWVADVADRALYRMRYERGEIAGEILATFPLGELADHVLDLTAFDGAIYLLTAPPGVPPALWRLDSAVAEWTALAATDIAPGVTGLTNDGAFLVLVEGSYLTTRDPATGQKVGGHKQLPDASDTSALSVIAPGIYGWFASFTDNQHALLRGARYDGRQFIAQLDTFSAVTTWGQRVGALSIAVPGSHVAGLEVYGNRAFLAVAGVGLPQPVVVEARLE